MSTSTSAAWQALEAHRREIGAPSLRRLFAADPGRAERMRFEAAGWTLDASKHLATEETVGKRLARSAWARLRSACSSRVSAFSSGRFAMA